MNIYIYIFIYLFIRCLKGVQEYIFYSTTLEHISIYIFYSTTPFLQCHPGNNFTKLGVFGDSALCGVVLAINCFPTGWLEIGLGKSVAALGYRARSPIGQMLPHCRLLSPPLWKYNSHWKPHEFPCCHYSSEHMIAGNRFA